jgi:hypothetical protein
VKFEVKGKDKTGAARRVSIDADDEASARRRAERSGFVIETIRLVNASPIATAPAAPVALPRTCANCDRSMGKLEKLFDHDGHKVCSDCLKKLKPEPLSYATPATPVIATPIVEDEYKALGISSRKWAWAIAILGLLTSIAGIGVLLFVWGIVADSMIASHRKKLKKATAAATKVSYLEMRNVHAGVKSLNMD